MRSASSVAAALRQERREDDERQRHRDEGELRRDDGVGRCGETLPGVRAGKVTKERREAQHHAEPRLPEAHSGPQEERQRREEQRRNRHRRGEGADQALAGRQAREQNQELGDRWRERPGHGAPAEKRQQWRREHDRREHVGDEPHPPVRPEIGDPTARHERRRRDRRREGRRADHGDEHERRHALECGRADRHGGQTSAGGWPRRSAARRFR